MVKYFRINWLWENTFIKNFRKKINKVEIINEKNINDKIVKDLHNLDCLIIDNYENNISENLLYSILNESKQLDNYILINSRYPIKNFKINLKDLKSRINSFVYIGIELPTDDLLQVIISKSFSDRQISFSPKISEYIIKNVDRSYENV